MDGQGLWYHIDQPDSVETLQITDARRDQSGHWAPDQSEINSNGTSIGCLGMFPSGLLHTRFDNDCSDTIQQACSYKGKPIV